MHHGSNHKLFLDKMYTYILYVGMHVCNVRIFWAIFLYSIIIIINNELTTFQIF